MSQPDIQIVRPRDGDTDKSLETTIKEENIRNSSKKARDFFSSIQEELDQYEGDFKEGLSFLDMKNDTILSYMIDLCNIMLLKVKGLKIEGHPSIERCVEYRVILEKVKGIDQRLSYQLNKLITMPEDSTQETQGIDVKNLDVDIDGSDDDGESADDSDQEGIDEDVSQSENSDDDEDAKEVPAAKLGKSRSKELKKDGIYKPPKLRSVVYDEEGYSEGRNKRRKTQDDDHHNDIDDDERRQYEEDNFTRLPSKPKSKSKLKFKAKSKAKSRSKAFKRRKP